MCESCLQENHAVEFPALVYGNGLARYPGLKLFADYINSIAEHSSIF